MDIPAMKAEFAKHYGAGGAKPGRVHVVRAPGRVNLIGEHTDYNDGFVFPMAIEPQIVFVCRARDDDRITIRSTVFPDDKIEFSLIGKIEKAEPQWANYVRGPIALLLEKGVPLVGMDCLIVNTLPMGGGLSSSAAMEVGTTRAMLTLAGEDLDATSIALLCQQAEHTFAGVPCGIMDQTIVASGQAGKAMLLDCRDNSRTFVPLNPADISVVIVNSMVKHELSGGEYAERRQQCETGVKHFQKTAPKVRALRDVTIDQVNAARDALGDVVFRRCRHVVTEIERCTRFAKHLTTQQYEQAGALMIESHNSLRDDYEVSVDELDFLVETGAKLRGVYGTRMTGGGFGGCTVSLVMPRHAEAFMSEIKSAYKKKFKIDPVLFATKATDGASVVE